jgi:2-oxoglutarate dehydrogenase E2 component (dihydrolipoamide succinyltransferase)
MKTPVQMQGVGLVEAVTVTEWLHEAGDKVKSGEPLVLVETEKATVEVVAPADGVLEISVPVGRELVPADVVLGYVDDGADGLGVKE